MDIKRLKYFCTVVECGSFTKAAEMLHISQPPLSKRVQELEQEIGTPLLFRDGGRIRPTPTGFFLYERALEILVGIGNIERDTLIFAQQQQHVLRIGLTHLYQKYFTPLIMAIHSQYADTEINVLVSDSSHLETLLNNQLIDVALIQQPKRLERYRYVALPAVQMAAVVHRSLLPDGVPDTMTLKQLSGLPLILLRRSSGVGTFEQLMDQLHKSGTTPQVIMHVSQPSVIVDWIESGIEAAALLPESEVCPSQLRNSVLVRVSPDPQVFFPALVKLTTTPEIRGLEEVMANGYPFVAPKCR
ncbi:LysR family transcriptional regulator [Eikenella sp. HMSC061C02]|uniref:LysR family transcriptional regulator n=1 Tax=Eikenella sp. HMSC061C02 TaxID=1715021 RepID=UPI0008A131A3|nr:LysR family transcriptional regulator [Eikenella sp. HMSC061C02]OFN63136.1 hypothetical protein HMPREF2541_04360 [Eikenella sp. HMSC061C02]